MKITLKPIQPKYNQFKAGLYKRLMDEATQEVTRGVRKDFQETTKTWNTKINWGTTRRGNDWYVSTRNEVFGYVDQGTRPHIIRPRGAKRLVFFRTGFKPKTRVGVIGSSAGRRANRDLTFALEVHHPGTKARGFSKKIREKWQKEWQKKMMAAIRKAKKG